MVKFNWQGEIPAHAQVEQEGRVIWSGAPRFYKADRQEGGFYVGSDFKGEELTCQIFDWRWDNSERWGRAGQSWLDLALVDGDGVAAILALNKDSAVNVFDFLISLKQTGASAIDPPALSVTLGFVRRETQEGEAYYLVDVRAWQFASEADWLKVAAFRDTRQFNWVLVGEVN